MLILTRRIGESFFISDEVEVRIVDLSPSRVKIGVIAPRNVEITRGEIRKTAEQNVQASQPASSDAVARLVAQLRFAKNIPTE